MLEPFSATVGQLYAAAADAVSWQEALSAVETLTRSAGAVVHIVRKGAEPGLVSLLGASAEQHFPQADVEQWTRELAPSCPRLATVAKLPDAPYVVDGMILSEREMDLDPVYDWYREHGLRYFIGSTLSVRARSSSRGAYSVRLPRATRRPKTSACSSCSSLISSVRSTLPSNSDCCVLFGASERRCSTRFPNRCSLWI